MYDPGPGTTNLLSDSVDLLALPKLLTPEFLYLEKKYWPVELIPLSYWYSKGPGY